MRFVGVMRALPLRLPDLRLVALVAAFWPAWQWLAMRATRDTGDAWALVSLVTAVALLWRERAGFDWARARWDISIALVLVYAVTFPFVPPLVRAILAMSALAAAFSPLWFGARMDLRLWGLLLLALPWVASLNFYLGYPLRVVVGDAAAMLLQLNGLAVVRDGTALLWNGQQVSIDAPCSGVKMLWTGLYLSCALAALYRLQSVRFMLLVTFALLIVLIANVMRAAALFYVEAGIAPQAAPAHELIGVILFGLAAAAIAMVAMHLRRPALPSLAATDSRGATYAS